ncbi:hypothetical protein Dip510_001659 [Elusimicrobium posterum]|uniref:hypothetical protein n=1 Tax=Elusimicrobium posterum TaxID=3116653 RepID=UPI003C7502AD
MDLKTFGDVSLFFFKFVCVCLVGGFSVIGLLQGLKQILPAKITEDANSGKILALANFLLCAAVALCVWHSLYVSVKISFVFLVYGGILSASQLGYEGLVKPAFDAILSKIKDTKE